MQFPKYHIIYAFAALALLSGCSDGDDWTPGPQDTETGVSAYFPMPTSSSYIFDSDGETGDMNVEVAVRRSVTDSEVSIPLVLTSETEGFSISSPAHFEAGQQETKVTVNCGGIPKGIKESFTLTLPADQTDIYGDGLTAVTYSVIKSEWKLIADDVRYLYSYDDYSPMYPQTYAEMYHLDGTYMFKLTDFFGSGLDVSFECPMSHQQATEAGLEMPFAPLDNAYWFEPSGYEGLKTWYLYDEATETYPEWVPGDVTGYPAISYLLFYGTTDYSGVHFNYYGGDNLYGYIALTCDVDFDNGDFSWGAYQVDFNLKYDPF